MYSDSDSNSDSDTHEMSEDTTQCLIDSMATQIADLQIERDALKEASDKLKNRIRTLECIVKSDILAKICNYL